MRLLLLGQHSSYGNRRIIEAGVRRGHLARSAGFGDIRISAADGGPALTADGEDLVDNFDALYVRRLYPYATEAYLIAGLFQRAGKYVVNKLATKGVVSSKTHDAIALEAAGIRVPRTVQCFTTDAFLREMKSFRYPVILKGVHGALGAYVYRVESEERLRELLEKRHRGFFSLQEYLPAEFDVRVMTVGYRTIGAMKRTVPAGDFRANIAVGGTGSAYPVTDELRRIAEAASRALHREFAGVDILFHEGKPYVLEVNQHPGFEGFEAATGIDVAEAFIRYLERRLPTRRA